MTIRKESRPRGAARAVAARRPPLWLATLFVAAGAAAWAQTARQGDPNKPVARTQFSSPMVLETVFAAADRSLWGKGRWFTIEEYHELGRFTCDGVSLRNDYSVRKGTWDSGLWMAVKPVDDSGVRVKIRAIVHNPRHNHDKLVNLVFEVLNGDRVERTVEMPPIPVEDNTDEVDKEVGFILPVAVLRTDPMTRLRITMTTKDD